MNQCEETKESGRVYICERRCRMVGMDDETRRLIDASCRMYVSVPFIELIQGKRPVMCIIGVYQGRKRTNFHVHAF